LRKEDIQWLSRCEPQKKGDVHSKNQPDEKRAGADAVPAKFIQTLMIP
jgi:hypothetical protein